MNHEQQHPLERYFDQPSDGGRRGTAIQSRKRGVLTWIAVIGMTLLAAAANVAIAATPYVNATVEGALLPGVYGRIEIGNAPPPPLLYPQPIIIVQQPVQVQQAPLYMHVPPGHAKKWSKHCSRYNACGRPVYFVKVNGDDDFERVQYQKSKDYKGFKEDKHKNDKHHGNGNGRGNGNGHGNGKHKGDN